MHEIALLFKNYKKLLEANGTLVKWIMLWKTWYATFKPHLEMSDTVSTKMVAKLYG